MTTNQRPAARHRTPAETAGQPTGRDASAPSPAALACPAPRGEHEVVLLGHGAGGRLSAELLDDLLLPALGGPGTAEPGTAATRAGARRPLEDAAVLPPCGPDELVLSTDSFVVNPLFFPGGDIGSLAVHGTINDVAMMGGRPFALALSVIVEEGFPLATLEAVVRSAGAAARAAGVPVVTGDTKVVGRGAADGCYLTTTGLGRRDPRGPRPSAARAAPGDDVLLSGPIGLHGTAVLSTREGLGFETDIASDSRPLHRLVEAVTAAAGDGLHALRDPTRGGVAATLNEIARDSAVSVELDEAALPVPGPVAAACELLGLDVLHVANEGCLLAFTAPGTTGAVLAAMRARPEGAEAVRVGRVADGPPGTVTLRTLVGSRRVVDMPTGEQLPRIC